MNVCKIEGCERKVFGHGWCHYHYQNWYRHGSPEPQIRHREAHGLRNTPEYDIWHAMNDRCHSSKNKFYRRYGGRGISVCKRWRHSFYNFYKDMGPRPFLGAQIDRIDNNSHYEPGNCRWVSREENQKNQPKRKHAADGKWLPAAMVVVDPLRYLEER